ncbi:hypothetical protein LJC64_03315 [Ruminococcaceae bacterium OttesenSCG-928-A11]|nr:hypothetical protein [Ruminococcaceae bacterium OttesenSCG-928-A11]
MSETILQNYNLDIEDEYTEQHEDNLSDWDAFRAEEQELDAIREQEEISEESQVLGQIAINTTSDGSFGGFGVLDLEKSTDDKLTNSDFNPETEVIDRSDFLFDKTDLLRKAAKQIRYANAKRKNWDRSSFEDQQSARKRAEKNIGKACLEFCSYFDGKSCKINPVIGSGSIINHLNSYTESTNFLKNLTEVERTRTDMKCSDLVKKHPNKL